MEIEFTALAPRDAGRRAFPAGATRSNARLARSARLGLRHDPMPRPKDVVCGRQRETMDERLVRRDCLRRLQALAVAPRKMCRRRRGTSTNGRSRDGVEPQVQANEPARLTRLRFTLRSGGLKPAR